MYQKGQALVILIAAIALIIGLVVGAFFFGIYWSESKSFSYKLDDINITMQDETYGNLNKTVSVVDNCGSLVESKTSDSRVFEINKTILINDGGVLSTSVKNFVSLEIAKSYEFQSQTTFTVEKNFDFVSSPGMISIHTVEWQYVLQHGSVETPGEVFDFSFPTDVNATQRTVQQSCK